MSLYAVVGVSLLCLGLPLSGRADDQDLVRKKVEQSQRRDAARQKQERAKASQVFQGEKRTGLTKHQTLTGSYIPQNYRKDGPLTNAHQNVSVYNRRDLEKNGYYDVGASLKRVDPSISIRGEQ